MSSGQYIEAQFDEHDLTLMRLLDFAKPSAEGSYYELTEKGDAWVKEWCALRIRKHNDQKGEQP